MKFNLKKFVIILIIGIVALVLIGGGFYYFINKNNQQKQLTFLRSQNNVYTNLTQEEKNNALLDASRQGDLNQVKKAIEASADINVKDINGNTPLIEASRRGQSEIVKALIAAGADVNARDNEGKTALVNSFGNGDDSVKMAHILTSEGADVNIKDNRGMVPLMLTKNPDVIDILIKVGASCENISIGDKYGSMFVKSVEQVVTNNRNELEILLTGPITISGKYDLFPPFDEYCMRDFDFSSANKLPHNDPYRPFCFKNNDFAKSKLEYEAMVTIKIDNYRLSCPSSDVDRADLIEVDSVKHLY